MASASSEVCTESSSAMSANRTLDTSRISAVISARCAWQRAPSATHEQRHVNCTKNQR
jgi:hypothetical protein